MISDKRGTVNRGTAERAPFRPMDFVKMFVIVVVCFSLAALFVVLLARSVPWAEHSIASISRGVFGSGWTHPEEIMTCGGRWDSGLWIALDCEDGPTAAPLAGIVAGPAPAAPAVARFVRLHQAGDYDCRILRSATAGIDHFAAICTAGAADLARHLVLSEAARPAPAGTPAWHLAPEETRAALAELQPFGYAALDAERRIGIQTWLATLLAFSGAIVAFLANEFDKRRTAERSLAVALRDIKHDWDAIEDKITAAIEDDDFPLDSLETDIDRLREAIYRFEELDTEERTIHLKRYLNLLGEAVQKHDAEKVVSYLEHTQERLTEFLESVQPTEAAQ